MANSSERARAVLELDVGREHVGGEQERPTGRAGRGPAGADESSSPRDVDVGPDPAGGREQEGAPGRASGESRDVGREQVVEPAAASVPPTRTFRWSERSANARPALERSPRSLSLHGASLCEIIWDDLRPVDIPRTLLVTNAFPPKVGGIQTFRGALAGAAGRSGRGARARVRGRGRYDAGAVPGRARPRAVHVAGARPAAAGSTAEIDDRSEVVVFGDAFPLAQLGPRLGGAGCRTS